MSPKSTELPSRKPRVFVDADVIFAGAAAPSAQSASHIILMMGELTLLNCVTSEQAVTEVTRNLADKLPTALSEFRLLVSRALRIVSDPTPEELVVYAGQADPKDLPLLVAALHEACPYFVTFNTRHYFPTGKTIRVMRPGELLLTIRQMLGHL
ncbi:MAG: PIN domain-containing protein [Anaerolineae bacterium]